MIKNIKKLFAGVVAAPLVAALLVGVSLSPSAGAATTVPCSTAAGNLTISGGSNCAKGNSQGANLTGVFKTVVNIMLFVVGAVAVIMLVIGGLRYVTSNGDQNAVTGAKNTIMYAIIGIVVAFLAFAAVGFVTTQLETGTANDQPVTGT